MKKSYTTLVIGSLILILLISFESLDVIDVLSNSKADTKQSINNPIENNETQPEESIEPKPKIEKFLIEDKDEALELLSERLNLKFEDFKYGGKDDDGGYIFYIEPTQGNNGASFVINPSTGNIYDDVSGRLISNIFITVEDEIYFITEEEIENLFLTKVIDEDANEKTVQLYGYMYGDYDVIVLDTQNNIIAEYRVSPVSGKVFDYITGELVTSLR